MNTRAGNLIIAALCVIICIPAMSFADDSLVLGVHPYLAAPEIVKRFSPLAAYLERKTGRTVAIQISKDYADHIDKIGRGEIDIAFMGPASFVAMLKNYGGRPLLGRLEVGGRPVFHGVIFVAINSPIMELSELKDKSFAFGDPASTMSHLIPRYMLFEAGVDIKDLSGYAFLKNHNNVALGVLMGDYDAGAVKYETFIQYKDRGLREIAVTPDISEHVFVTRKDLDPGLVETLRSLLIGLGDSPEGKAILTSIKSDITDIVPANSADYDSLRKILTVLDRLGVDY